MLAVECEPISLERMKQIMDQLSAPGQLENVSSDINFLKQRAGLVHSMYGYLQQACSNQQACKQLLSEVPQLLRQLAVITTAVLQQLAKLLDREVQVSRAAGLVADALAKLLPVMRGSHTIEGQPYDPSAPADTATIRVMQETGACTGVFLTSGQLTHPLARKNFFPVER
jgi:hypothetical protein